MVKWVLKKAYRNFHQKTRGHFIFKSYWLQPAGSKEVLWHTYQDLWRKNFDASRIFNCDETGMITVEKLSKILRKRGKHQIGSLTSGEREKNVATVCCMSATGSICQLHSFFLVSAWNLNLWIMQVLASCLLLKKWMNDLWNFSLLSRAYSQAYSVIRGKSNFNTTRWTFFSY